MRTRAEHQAIAEAWNLNGRPCVRGHTGEWKVSGSQSPHCATCHREKNRDWRHRTTVGIHPPKPGRAWRHQGPKVEAKPRPSGFQAPPDEYVLPWNRGIGPEEPSRP